MISKVRITAKVSYQVIYVPKNNLPQDHLACCDPATKLITIRKDLSRRQTRLCLIHEIIHAMEYEYGFLINHRSIMELEEPILKFLELNNHIKR